MHYGHVDQAIGYLISSIVRWILLSNPSIKLVVLFFIHRGGLMVQRRHIPVA